MLEVNKLCEAKTQLLKKRVVVFDLDDTLYSEKDYVRSGFEEVGQQFKAIDNMANKLWDAFISGKQAIDYVLEREGLLSNEAKQICLEVYRNHLPKISIYPEAKRLITELLNHGISLGMITDGRPEGQRAKIKALNIENYFEKIIVTDELGGPLFRKPNVVAFEKMQSYFDVPYDSMAYVGDNLKKDFIAPNLLGMDSIYFNNPEGLYSARMLV